MYKGPPSGLGPPVCTRYLPRGLVACLYNVPPIWAGPPVYARSLLAWLAGASCLYKGLPAGLGPPVCTTDLQLERGLLFVQGTSRWTCGLPVQLHGTSYPAGASCLCKEPHNLVDWGLLFVQGPPDWAGASSLYKVHTSHLDFWPACTRGLLSGLGPPVCAKNLLAWLASWGLLFVQGPPVFYKGPPSGLGQGTCCIWTGASCQCKGLPSGVSFLYQVTSKLCWDVLSVNLASFLCRGMYSPLSFLFKMF